MRIFYEAEGKGKYSYEDVINRVFNCRRGNKCLLYYVVHGIIVKNMNSSLPTGPWNIRVEYHELLTSDDRL